LLAAWWWIRNVGLVIGGLFFLLVGIQTLIAAYRLNNPAYFILTFFASNLMILISAALVLGFILRIVRRVRQGPEGSLEKDNKKH
jgi:hypothetical protein